jgi:hypothetical protein
MCLYVSYVLLLSNYSMCVYVKWLIHQLLVTLRITFKIKRFTVDCKYGLKCVAKCVHEWQWWMFWRLQISCHKCSVSTVHSEWSALPYGFMFCWPCIIIYQYSRTNKMHFLCSVYYELTASTCFEHYLLTFRRRCINNNWCIACLLLAGCYQGWSSTSTLVAASIHNMHAIYQLLFMQRLLKVSK